MQKRNRLLCLLTALALTLAPAGCGSPAAGGPAVGSAPTAAPAPASAAPSAPAAADVPPESPAQSGAPAALSCGDELTWSFDRDTLTVSGSGPMFDFSLLEAPWDQAGHSFRVERLVVESGVTYLGSDAFAACCNLREITLPDTLTGIGDFAFADCVALRAITLPSSLLSVGISAFSGSGLESLSLPIGLTSLGDLAFAFCSGLREVTLPDTLCSVGDGAFSQCAALETIHVKTGSPAEQLLTGTELEGLLVSDGTATDLNEMIWSGSSQGLLWQLRSGELSLSGSGEMPEYTASGGSAAPWSPLSSLIREIRVGSGVTTVGSYAFWSCSRVTAASLPDGLTVIGDYAFGACEALEEMALPDTVTRVGAGAFSCCTSLRQINLPDGLESIGEDAFQMCYALEELHIPGSVQSIGAGAFELGTSLSAPLGSYAESWLRENGWL